MFKKSLQFFLCVVLFLGMSVTFAYSGNDPVPEDNFHAPVVRDYTDAQVDEVVTMEQETVAPYRSLSEYGVDPSAIPEGCPCNRVQFMRYRLNDDILGVEDPQNALYADAGLLMVPGVVEGANGFQHIARHLIYKAYMQRGLRIEVWAMDRRANCLEDLTGSQKVESMYKDFITDDKDGDGVYLDPGEEKALLDTSIGYYYKNQTIDGKTFDGWYSSEDLPFIAEFGLKMDTEDMYQIIEAMVPDQKQRNGKVFVGGHSLGGLHTSFFAGWDKDGDPMTKEDVGYNNAAGIFCFDSFLTPMDQMVNDVVKGYLSSLSDEAIDCGKEMTKPLYKAALAGLRSGDIPRIAEGDLAKSLAGSPIGPEIMSLLEIQGMLADARPGKEHIALERVYDYVGEDVKTTLQKYISRNCIQNYLGEPDILDYRFTNEAILGLFFDDNFTHVDMIAASMGFMYNGPVAEKGRILTSGKSLFVPTDSGYDFWKWHVDGPLYKWADFDEVARPGDPLTSKDGSVVYTTYETEMSDIQDLSRALYSGPTNMVEWYFPIRKMVDMLAAITDYGAKDYGLNCLYSQKVAEMPQIEFVGGEGLLGENEQAIPGVNHMDPMFASANTSNFKDNPVIDPLLDFVQENRVQ